jgi:hypothetical protein
MASVNIYGQIRKRGKIKPALVEQVNYPFARVTIYPSNGSSGAEMEEVKTLDGLKVEIGGVEDLEVDNVTATLPIVIV